MCDETSIRYNEATSKGGYYDEFRHDNQTGSPAAASDAA